MFTKYSVTVFAIPLLWCVPAILAIATSFDVRGYTTTNSTPGIGAGELREVEVEHRQNDARSKCIASKLVQTKLPWYYYYELGVKLIEEHKAPAAIEALQISALMKAMPVRGKRMYGMWFVDYLPYYQLSRAFAANRDWESALDCLALSESMMEFSPSDTGYENYLTLKGLLHERRWSPTRD